MGLYHTKPSSLSKPNANPTDGQEYCLPHQPCPAKQKPLGNIIAIKILNGDDESQYLTQNGYQYVNLTREDHWIYQGQPIPKYRCGKEIRVLVEFDRPGIFDFNIKLVASSNNVVYTQAELSRNINFKFREDSVTDSTNKNGKKIIDSDLFVSCAGLNQFHFEATDENNTTVRSVSIQTRRILHYIEAKMLGLTSITPTLELVKSEYQRHGIVLESLGTIYIDYMENIGTDTEKLVLRQHIQTSRKQAINNGSIIGNHQSAQDMLTIVYTGNLSVKTDNVELGKNGVRVGTSEPSIYLPIMATDISSGNQLNKRLWKNIVINEDWFISGQFFPIENGQRLSPITIEKQYIQPQGVSPTGQTEYGLNIDVSHLPDSIGNILIKVRVIDRTRAGLSLPGSDNLALTCTLVESIPTTTEYQQSVLIHEIGHQIEMVSDGAGIKPNPPAYYYTGNGHIGNHCCNPLPQLNDYRNIGGYPTPVCVMFGATTGKLEFCSECAMAVKKMDLC